MRKRKMKGLCPSQNSSRMGLGPGNSWSQGLGKGQRWKYPTNARSRGWTGVRSDSPWRAASLLEEICPLPVLWDHMRFPHEHASFQYPGPAHLWTSDGLGEGLKSAHFGGPKGQMGVCISTIYRWKKGIGWVNSLTEILTERRKS